MLAYCPLLKPQLLTRRVTVPNEGWALRAAKKAYRFREKQKSYLLAKFSIGQTTGRKLDAEVVAREMRRARGADSVRLFQSSEFLTSLQIASLFSRQSATLRQKMKQMKPISGHLKRKLTLVQRRRSLKPFSSTILWYTISTTCVR